ncbi:MAG: holin family protein [Rhodobacteraceae bacterium]|nr:holin family protein [Paracoccaceae bacterium]
MGLIAVLARALFVRGGAAEIGRVGTGLAEVFRPNATRQMELSHDAFTATQAAYAAEYRLARRGWFDTFVNGLNRLPRPFLALATPALFAYAMWDPAGFTVRMQGLSAVPEPLWWLLGAVVAFYFGARETHYMRAGRGPVPPVAAPEPTAGPLPATDQPEDEMRGNPALADWLDEGRAGR